jgi:hypothetical protein
MTENSGNWYHANWIPDSGTRTLIDPNIVVAIRYVPNDRERTPELIAAAIAGLIPEESLPPRHVKVRETRTVSFK